MSYIGLPIIAYNIYAINIYAKLFKYYFLSGKQSKIKSTYLRTPL